MSYILNIKLANVLLFAVISMTIYVLFFPIHFYSIILHISINLKKQCAPIKIS